jgi:hypothetical protein
MRLPSLTIRRLMIIVALLALAAGVIVMLIQSERYRQRAVYHSKMEADTQKMMGFYRGDMVLIKGAARENFPDLLDKSTRRNLYHSEMKRKWEDAVKHPWLSVEPDPPEPK